MVRKNRGAKLKNPRVTQSSSARLESGGDTSSTNWFVLFLASCICIVSYFIYFRPKETQIWDFEQHVGIFTQQYNPQWNFTRFIGATEPILIRGFKTHSGWKAFKKWSPSKLAKRLGKVSAYCQSSNEFSTFHDDKPLETFLHSKRWADFNEKCTINFLNIFVTNKEKRYAFSNKLDRLGDDFIQEVSPHANLWQTSHGRWINLWTSAEGSLTATHYDTNHNSFVQIFGTKIFYLWPLHLIQDFYPTLHPQSGHPIRSLDNLLEIPHLKVTVKAGDILLIPPYTIHAVQSISASLSVNFWSDSASFEFVQDVLYAAPIPFEADWGLDLRITGLVSFYCILPHFSDQSLAIYILENRYAPLFESSKSQEFIDIDFLEGTIPSCTQAEELLREQLLGDAERVLDGLRKIVATSERHNWPSRDVKRVLLANYLEHVINLVLGTSNVLPFFKALTKVGSVCDADI